MKLFPIGLFLCLATTVVAQATTTTKTVCSNGTCEVIKKTCHEQYEDGVPSFEEISQSSLQKGDTLSLSISSSTKYVHILDFTSSNDSFTKGTLHNDNKLIQYPKGERLGFKTNETYDFTVTNVTSEYRREWVSNGHPNEKFKVYTLSRTKANGETTELRVTCGNECLRQQFEDFFPFDSYIKIKTAQGHSYTAGTDLNHYNSRNPSKKTCDSVIDNSYEYDEASLMEDETNGTVSL